MVETSICPKCGGYLNSINQMFAKFECEDCGQRMDKRDYIIWAIKNFTVDLDLLFEITYEGVNRE